MLITRVELENIKSYDEGAFRFGPGVTAISGPNGAGKTTILEAIAWALFDHLPYKKEDFLKRGARKGSVRVTFESAIDSREYTVYRDTGAGYYAYDPITKLRLVEQKSQVIGWIKQHLGVEPTSDLRALFMSTIGVPQGTFTVDFADQPAKRKLSFDRVLRVDEYNRSSDELRYLVRLVESKGIDLREEIARLEVEVSSLDPFIAERERLDQAIKRLREDLAAEQQKRESLKRELQQLDDLQRIIEQSARERENLNVKVTDLDIRKTAASEAANQSRRAKDALLAAAAGFEIYNKAVARLAELETQAIERDVLKNRYAETERDLIRVETSLEAEKAKLQELEAARDELERLTPLEKEQAELEENRSRIQTDIGKLEAVKERAAAAAGELDSFRKEFAKLKKQIEDAESHREVAEKYTELEESRRLCESKLRELEVAEQRRKDRLRELGRVREKISNIEGEVKTLDREIRAAEKSERLAGLVPELESNDQSLMEEITALRMSIDRESKLVAQIEGGLCPLLNQKCLNMKNGEGLDQYFTFQIGNERERLSESEKRRKQVQRQLSEAKSAQRVVSALENQRVLRQRYGQELEIERGSSSRMQAEIEQISVSPDLLREAKDNIARIEKELAEAQAARVKYENLPALRERQGRLTTEGKEKKKALEDMNARIAAMSGLTDELKAIEKSLEDLNDPRGRCRQIRQSLKREPEIKKSLAVMEKRKEELSSILHRLSEEIIRYAALDEQLMAERERRAASERDYGVYIENKPIASLLETRESELKSIETELAQSLEALSLVEAKLGEARSRYDAARHTAARVEYEEAISRTGTLESELNATLLRIEEIENEIKRLRTVRERMQKLVEERDRCVEIMSIAEFIREVLKQAAPYITEAHVQMISLEANQLYRDITGNPLVSLRWDSGYEIILEEDGHDRPFASLSGGEQMAAALAVRLAMLKELSDVRIAFFDEPTTNMDEERRRNLAQQIGRIRDFDQLFVISHDDAFEGATDQIVAVGARE